MVRRYVTVVGKPDRPVADADHQHHRGQPQSDLDGAAVDPEEGHHPQDAQGPGLYRAHAHARARWRRATRSIRASVDWQSDRTPNFTVRQDSGDGNALGAVRIDMPNPHSVYMHDTNHQEFFSAPTIASSPPAARACRACAISRPGCSRTIRAGAAQEIDAEIATGQAHRRQARAQDSGRLDLSHRLGDARTARSISATTSTASIRSPRATPWSMSSAAAGVGGARLGLRAAIGRRTPFSAGVVPGQPLS